MVTWVCGICAGLLALIYLGNKQQSYKGAGALIAVIIVSLLLGTFSWTQSTGEKLTVSLVQGGVQQEKKWLICITNIGNDNNTKTLIRKVKKDGRGIPY